MNFLRMLFIVLSMTSTVSHGIGGDDPLKPSDYPFIVSASVMIDRPATPTQGEYLCSATRVSKNIVVTAAQCIDELPKNVMINGKPYVIEKTAKNPLYNGGQDSNHDVAVILYQPVKTANTCPTNQMDDTYATLAKPTTDDTPQTEALIAGYGGKSERDTPYGRFVVKGGSIGIAAPTVYPCKASDNDLGLQRTLLRLKKDLSRGLPVSEDMSTSSYVSFQEETVTYTESYAKGQNLTTSKPANALEDISTTGTGIYGGDNGGGVFQKTSPTDTKPILLGVISSNRFAAKSPSIVAKIGDQSYPIPLDDSYFNAQNLEENAQFEMNPTWSTLHNAKTLNMIEQLGGINATANGPATAAADLKITRSYVAEKVNRYASVTDPSNLNFLTSTISDFEKISADQHLCHE